VFFQHLKTYFQPIIEILRWNKPTGRLILLIPAGWSLWLTPEGNPSINLVIKILLGGLFVSGFGCIANDIWDKDIDKKVLRTKNRPLASSKLSLSKAYFILYLFLLGSFFITLSLPAKGRLLTIILALLALPFILIYPSAKRWFRFPQVILSICWGFAVLIPWAAHEGNLRSPVLFLCWLATVFWTFGFDTIYALADKKYDQKIGINSSAINLGSYTKPAIQISYLITSLSIALCGIINELSLIFWPFLIINSILMQKDVYKIFKLKDSSIKTIAQHFRNQVIYGSLILIGIIIS
tara:strand:- start:855 stop:1739 length:885 start_codon:yes stop_codon:yes gene_type:complete